MSSQKIKKGDLLRHIGGDDRLNHITIGCKYLCVDDDSQWFALIRDDHIKYWFQHIHYRPYFEIIEYYGMANAIV